MPTPGTPSGYGRGGAIYGTTGAQFEVDDLGQAQVVLRDAAGNALYAQPVGAYMFPVEMRQTAALASGDVVWAMHNKSTTKVAHVRRIHLVQSFDDIPTAATTLTYSLMRFSGTSIDTGTSLGSAEKLDTAYDASDMFAAVDPGVAITGTGIVDSPLPFHYCTLALVQAIGVLPIALQLTAPNAVHDLRFGNDGAAFGGLVLRPDEGFAIHVANTVGIVGSALGGSVYWEEFEL